MIGTKLYKNNKEDMKQYTKTAQWCNKNNAHIEDKGEYYEVVENTPYVPTKEEKLAALDEEYTREKATLCEQYTDAQIHGDIDTAEEIVNEMTSLDNWYDEEYQKITNEGGEA